MTTVLSETGAPVFVGKSDAECVRWWWLHGKRSDTLDTGEPMSEVAELLQLDEGPVVTVDPDRCRCGHTVGQHELRTGGRLGCFLVGCGCIDFEDAPCSCPCHRARLDLCECGCRS